MDLIVLKSFIPEAFLSLSILYQLVYNIRTVNNLNYNYPIIGKEVYYQTLFILFCLLSIYFNLKIEGFLSNFLFVNDESTRVLKIIFVLVCLFSLPIVSKSFYLQEINFFEFYVILLISTLSLVLLTSSHDLIALYLTIEMQALSFYVLATLKRGSSFSTEAGLKYFISGSFMSGFFLLGSSFLYGTLGTINLSHLNILLSFPIESYSSEMLIIIKLGIAFITSTLLFKIACAPFHFWSPDVYEGSPLSSTIVFSIVPKLSIFFFFIKWICSINIIFTDGLQDILLYFGLFSTFLGTIYALNQQRVKRLIIYSSIAQIGFLVAGLSTNTLEGYTSVYFFLLIYIMTSILIWGHIAVFYLFSKNISNFYEIENNKINTLFLSSLSNFYKLNSIWALSFVIVFFSIAGIPPLAGFLSKILVLSELITTDKIFAAIILIIISSVSAFYYIRMIKIIFFEPKNVNNRYETFQIVFVNNTLDFIYLIFSILLFVILISFFYPNGLLLISQYLVLNSSLF